MRATDFNLKRDIKFNVDTGYTTFKGSRLVIFDAEAMGLLRREVTKQVGLEAARRIFLSQGYRQGFSDFQEINQNYHFDDELELLASGPVIHSWQGVVHAKPLEINIDHAEGVFRFTGIWRNSYEAEQHLSFNDLSDAPVCWGLMGYASGWCSAFFGAPLVAYETSCMGQGHKHCAWLVQPPEAFGEELAEHVSVLEGLWAEVSEKLSGGGV